MDSGSLPYSTGIICLQLETNYIKCFRLVYSEDTQRLKWSQLSVDFFLQPVTFVLLGHHEFVKRHYQCHPGFFGSGVIWPVSIFDGIPGGGDFRHCDPPLGGSSGNMWEYPDFVSALRDEKHEIAWVHLHRKFGNIRHVCNACGWRHEHCW